MNQLSPQARRLLELARGADDPGNLDQARVGRLLASRLAAGGELPASSVAGKTSAGKLFTAALKPALLALGVGGALGGAVFVAGSRDGGVASSPVTSSPATPTLAAPPTPSASSVAVAERGAAPSAAPNAPPKLASDEARQAPQPKPALGRGVEESAARPGLERPAVTERSLAARPRDGTSPEADAKIGSVTRSSERQDDDVSRDAKTAPKADPLRAEAEGLREAQRALRNGQAQQALDLLAAQDARFGSGLLAEERAAARVLSLCQAGLAERAHREAARFAARWPRSALLSRVQAGCLRE